MGQDNGHNQNPAIEVVRHIKATHSPSGEVTYRETLTALALVYRGDSRNPINQSIKGVISCEREVHRLTEDQFLEAVRIVFAPKYPIVYPDQFRPFLIIDVDGRVLWMHAPEPKPALPEPADNEPRDEAAT